MIFFVFLETMINLKGEETTSSMKLGESPDLAEEAFCRFF